jgi:hypothetical protein
MTCKHCGHPITKCQLGALVVPGQVCYHHTDHGWHRCDGQFEDTATTPGTVAEPAVATGAR